MYENRGRTCPFILYPRQNIGDVCQCVLENYGKIKYELPFINALCVDIPKEKVQTIKTNRRIATMSEDIQVSKLVEPQPFTQSQRIIDPVQPVQPAQIAQPLRATPSTQAVAQPPRFVHATQPAQSFQALRNAHRCFAPAMGSDGKGVSIAVIDTGVAPHYDLVHPLNRICVFQDFVNGKLHPYDDDGHGTHVAGIALGNGYVSGSRDCQGTAPGADLAALKSLDQEGNGNASDILAAMQWIYDNHRHYNIKVANLSLGICPSGQTQIDPLVLGANELVHAGICVVAAAGNSGPEWKTITSPGISPLVITVGSCDNYNRIPDFSSRGPTPTRQIKPDVVAPGVDILSLSAGNPKEYVAHSGTSMSAPYVAGLAACYCAEHPKAQPLDVKRSLLRAALPIKNVNPNIQGHGLL